MNISFRNMFNITLFVLANVDSRTLSFETNIYWLIYRDDLKKFQNGFLFVTIKNYLFYKMLQIRNTNFSYEWFLRLVIST